MEEQSQTPSVAFRTAASHLKDAQEQREKLDSIGPSDVARAIDQSHEALAELHLAFEEIKKADEEERLFLLPLLLFEQGLIWLSQSEIYQKAQQANEYQKEIEENWDLAAQLFSEAARLKPCPRHYFQLAVVENALDRHDQAIENFQKVVDGDDPELAIEARKMINRVQADKQRQAQSEQAELERRQASQKIIDEQKRQKAEREKQYAAQKALDEEKMAVRKAKYQQDTKQGWVAILCGIALLFVHFQIIGIPFGILISLGVIGWGWWRLKTPDPSNPYNR